jgi:cytochrome c biogenesis protein CcmG, thiol:disulfide interchange protein DsbE
MAGRLKLAGQVLSVALVAALFALLAWKLATQGEGAAEKLRRGEITNAPSFRLDRLDRPGKLSLASYRGRPVVINFWASWCDPCEEEAPLLEGVWQKYRSRGLVVLGIDANDARSAARRFAKRNRMSYPLVHDGPGETLTDYGIAAFPETFFVRRDGKLVCERLQGGVHLERNRERFHACVDEILAA